MKTEIVTYVQYLHEVDYSYFIAFGQAAQTPGAKMKIVNMTIYQNGCGGKETFAVVYTGDEDGVEAALREAVVC